MQLMLLGQEFKSQFARNLQQLWICTLPYYMWSKFLNTEKDWELLTFRSYYPKPVIRSVVQVDHWWFTWYFWWSTKSSWKLWPFTVQQIM